MSWSDIHSILQRGLEVKQDIPQWLDWVSSNIIEEGFRELFPHWTDTEIELFGTLGVGSGGYGVYFEKSILIIMRMIVNDLRITKGVGLNGSGGEARFRIC